MDLGYFTPSSTENMTLSTKSHAFNVGLAIDFNVTIALWLGHLAHWAEKNLANNKHIHDGLVWSYDTLDALSSVFPYMTRRQIETMVNKSIQYGLVVKGNYNKTAYDRTCWYALTPKSYFYFTELRTSQNIQKLYSSISQKCEMEITEFGNGFFTNVTPIPDTNPNTDPYVCGEQKKITPSTHTRFFIKNP